MSNITWHSLNVKALFFSGLILVGGVAGAAEKQVNAEVRAANDQASQLWLTTGFRSYHFERDANYNENNTGLGFEWRFNDEQAVAIGIYDNSVRRNSRYLHYVWTPVKLGPIRLGGAAGIIDGYPDMNDSEFAFSLIPVASLHFKVFSYDAGLNLVYIPTITERVDGSVALQLKIRLK